MLFPLHVTVTAFNNDHPCNDVHDDDDDGGDDDDDDDDDGDDDDDDDDDDGDDDDDALLRRGGNRLPNLCFEGLHSQLPPPPPQSCESIQNGCSQTKVGVARQNNFRTQVSNFWVQACI